MTGSYDSDPRPTSDYSSTLGKFSNRRITLCFSIEISVLIDRKRGNLSPREYLEKLITED